MRYTGEKGCSSKPIVTACNKYNVIIINSNYYVMLLFR